MDIGAELRAAREAKGFSLATLAQRTRVQPRILEAIELNNLSAIPPKPFGRGFVRSYAQEVDLDPANIVHHYFAQFPASVPPVAHEAEKRPTSRSFELPAHWTGFGMALAIILLLVTAAVLRQPSEESRAEPGAVGTSGAAAAKPAASTTAAASAPASAPAPVAAEQSSAAPVRVAFSVTRPCWVTARVDGQRVIYKIVAPGESPSLDAQREIDIRFGDAGAVQATINGRESGPLGPDGAVRDLHATPDR
jgi:cytoskeleton protein RodZ